ncbi:MAG: hypothetical protein CMC55_00170 [Flavobacteriaceae bacterium]|nr:hypothetical protein [Flavobacteriaceae bacterium]
MNKTDIKKLINLFANKTGCGIQEMGCPCNTCFHSIETDFRHICWLLILSLRGDYKFKEVYGDIEKELLK